jgi:hypothetical protein
MNGLGGQVLIGIEPMTSSMPFPRPNEQGQIDSDTKRHREAVFMRVSGLFAAFCVYLSDTTGDGPTRAGMRGL